MQQSPIQYFRELLLVLSFFRPLALLEPQASSHFGLEVFAPKVVGGGFFGRLAGTFISMVPLSL